MDSIEIDDNELDKEPATILLVEDDVFVAKGLSLHLARHYDIVTCGSGAEALETVENVSPDVLLVDFQLPDVDGIELVQRIYEATGKKEVPAIMISAHPNRKVACLDAGFHSFIEKPFPPAEVIWKIESALGRLAR